MNTSLTNYTCNCHPGYEGKQCERMIDFCGNVTCENRGICSRELLNYTCNCLAGFYGRHCETTETGNVVRGYVRKSSLKNSNFLTNVFLSFFTERFRLCSDYNVGVSSGFYCCNGRIKIWFWN